MFEFVRAGGWVMLPLILCSIVGTAIVLERMWALRSRRVSPPNLVKQVWQLIQAGHLDEKRLNALKRSSPLGQLLAAGLAQLGQDRAVMKESIEDIGRHVVHELERHLGTLATIAEISPLLGLLGTVFGMIKMFGAVDAHGLGNPSTVAGGIAQSLVTTAAGLIVAIPAVMFHRYFRRRVDDLVVTMEQDVLKMVDVLHGDRELK
jgi:biopolymer transport protein ExbB